MTRLGLLVVGLALLAAGAGARAEQTAGWEVVCAEDGATTASHCYLSFLAGDMGKGKWLGIAVQRLNGPYEVQVTGNGEDFGRAELNVQSDTTLVTDYCYDSYCVFVQADELVEQFRRGDALDVALYDGRGVAALRERISLRGFAKALKAYLTRIDE